MPTRIYPVRPLGRRYGYYGAQQASPYAGAFKAGSSFGNELVSGIGKAMAARKAQQQQDAQNALANQLENTVTPPRAGLVAPGVNSQTGAANAVGVNVPTAGTAPFSAGAAGMKLQQDFIRSQLENQELAQKVRNNQIAANMATRRGGGVGGGVGGGGNANRWQQYLGGGQGSKSGQVDQFGNPVKAGKPAAYQANSSTETDPGYYDFNHQRIDVDAQYGKGTHDRLLAGSGQLGPPDPKTGVRTTPDATVDAQGDVTKPPSMTVDAQGNVTLAPKGSYGGAYMPAAEAQKNMARNDAAAVQHGASPRFTDQYLKTQHPEAGLPGGDAANPYTPKSTLELTAVPPGKSFVNPTDGKVYTKQPPNAPTQPPPGQKTSQTDTGDQGQQVAGGQPSPQTQGLAGGDQGQGQDFSGQPQLSPVLQGPHPPIDPMAVASSNTPGSFDIGQPTSGGLPQDQQLADEIKRSQLASQLQGVA